MTPTRITHLACIAALVLTTACSPNQCGPVYRIVEASGRFGDTLAAVSGDGKEAGTVSVSLEENRWDHGTSWFGSFLLNTTGITDSVSLYQMTLRSDATRSPQLSFTGRGRFTTDSVTFERMWVHLATEDVLFEITAPDGGVAKSLLNLESRTGPAIRCVRT